MALTLAIMVLTTFSTSIYAACPTTILPGNGSTSGNARAPLGNFRFERGVYLITAAEIAAAGFASGQTIGNITWTYATGHNISVAGNLQVWFENTADVTSTKSTTWATAVGTMSNAHNAAATIPAGTTFSVNLTGAPFTYTGGGLYVAFEWSNAVNPLSVGAVVSCTNQPVAAMLNSAQSNVALPTTLAAASNFRPQTTITASGFANDAKVGLIYTQGKMANNYTTGHVIQARITNDGSNTLTNLNVNLNISGANTFGDIQTIASLAPCATTTVTFAGYTPVNVGANTISVSVPSDDNNINNTGTMPQDITESISTYRYIAPITGGVGFTGATGDFVGKFTAANAYGNADTLNGFEVIFTSTGQPYTVGIWDDNAGVPGTNIYTSAPQVSVADTVFISLPDVVVSGNYYIGIRQTGTTNIGFGFQTENPVRVGSFFFTSPTGNTVWTDFNTAAANFRISATVQYKTPVPPNCAVYLAPLNLSNACQNGVTLTYGSGGGGPTGYRVYFGTNQALVEAEDPSTLVQNSAATTYPTGVLTGNTTYYWRVTAYNVQGDATSCVGSKSFNTNLVSCYCTSTATNATFEHITNVQSGAFSNPSLSTLYSNYTGLGIINNVNINSTFNITVTIDALNVFNEDRIYVFADFNQDGDWADAGELCGDVDVTIAGGNVYVVPCTVPAGALGGNTLLRIKFGDEVSTTAMTNDPCQVSYTFGEVEDYLLNVACGAQVSATNPACENSALNLTATYLGAGTPVSYSWTTTAANGFTSASANPLVTASANPVNDAGDYTVVITDNNGCTSTATVTVLISSAPVASVSSNSPVCEGGSIQLIASGGNFYSWSGPGAFVPNGNVSNPAVLTATVADGGTYTVTVTDLFGCTVELTEIVVVNSNPSLSLVSQTDVSCAGGSDGSFTVVATGGAGIPYQYDENGNINFDGIFNAYAEGTYTVITEDANTCKDSISVVVGAISVAPPANSITITSAPATACVGNTVVLTTNAVIGATGYTWSVDPGTLVNGQPGPATTTLPTATLTLGAVPANSSGWSVCVSGFNGCGQTNTKCVSIRGVLSPAGPVSGATVACENTSGSYSIAAIGGASGYQWSGTNGITFTGTGTNVVANFPNGFTSGSICVSGTLSCGYVGPQRCISVSTSSGLLGAMNPASSYSVCPGQTNAVYSVPSAVGIASYNWTVPANMTITSGQGTNNIVASVGAGFTLGQVCVTATSTCGVVSPPRCKGVSTAAPYTPGNMTGNLTGVCGLTLNYSVPSNPNITSYSWTAPAGATINSGNGTNAISVTFSNSFTTGQICVTANNACGTSPARCINVKGAPGIAGNITGNTTVCANETGIQYSVATVFGATSYNWSVPSGATIISGANTNSIVVDWGVASGNVIVTAANACGNSGSKVLAVTVNCRLSASNESINMNVYPNPVSTELTLDLTGMNDGEVAIEITDLTGRIINSFKGQILNSKFISEVNVSNYSKGVYLLKASNVNGQQAAIRFNVQ